MNHDQASLLDKVLKKAVDFGASDVHASPGEPIHFRIDGQLHRQVFEELDDNCFNATVATDFSTSILSESQEKMLAKRGSVDGSFSLDLQNRFRFNIYCRGGERCFALRHLANSVPSLNDLGLNDQLYGLCDLTDGLVLVAGPTGSGKSTTIAALIDRINQTRACHIVTIEDPIEFVHRSSRALVNQRQIGTDVASFSQAILDAVRQDPDVILVGEIRDLDTIRTAITAAETGHLVFATVHAGDCKTAVERLVGAFPADEQNLAQRLVATVLRTVIVQHLLPSLPDPHHTIQDSTRVLASEVMRVNSAVSNLIASGNLNQLASTLQTGGEGMWTLDASLARLWRSRKISEQTARSLARNPEILSQLARRAKT